MTSWDFFDTLMGRACGEPWRLFEAVGGPAYVPIRQEAERRSDKTWGGIFETLREITGWEAGRVDGITDDAGIARILRFAAEEVVPRLAGTAGEIDQVLRALDGHYIAAGPSGSPLRGLVNVLPTGRNFYSVDPKAMPSRLAWETGVAMADSLLARYRADYGDWPRSVGISAWGTSAMRTSGDDIAEILALLGVRPVWDDASQSFYQRAHVPEIVQALKVIHRGLQLDAPDGVISTNESYRPVAIERGKVPADKVTAIYLRAPDAEINWATRGGSR